MQRQLSGVCRLGLKHRIASLSHHKEQSWDVSQEQHSELSHALSDEDGKPHKGSKST